MTWVLSGKPYAVQMEALKHSEGKRGWGHGLEMGLGKTAVTLNEYFELWQAGEVEVLLVLCPYNLTGTWKDQIEFWAKGYDAYVHVWPNVTKYQMGSPNIYVLYYESVSVGGKKGAAFAVQLLEERRTMLVIEESVEIKNHKAVRTQFILANESKATFARALTGWPIVKGPNDIWPQIRALGARPGNYYSFRNRFCRMGGFKGNKVIGIREDAKEEFEQLLHEWFWFALKKDWTDLPEKTYLPSRRAEMTPIQLKHYKSMLQNFIVMLDQKIVTSQMVATQMNKLAQISSGFIYDEQGNPHWLVDEPSKAKELLAILEQNSHTKFIVFANFQPTIDFLAGYLTKNEIKFSLLAGKGTMKGQELDFQKQKHKFNLDDDTQVALCQSSSTKYGLTLLGTAARPCYNTVYYENIYDLNVRIQTEDRNHRHGQKNAVGYLDLISSPVEKKIVDTLTANREETSNMFQARTLREQAALRKLLQSSVKDANDY